MIQLLDAIQKLSMFIVHMSSGGPDTPNLDQET
jgi:hypothetical protein